MIKLTRDFYTTLDFDELKGRLKRKLGANYKLGLIDKEEIILYYLKDRYTENGLDRVPTCKLEIKNEKEEDGRIRIKFAIAEFSFVCLCCDGKRHISKVKLQRFSEGKTPYNNMYGPLRGFVRVRTLVFKITFSND